MRCSLPPLIRPFQLNSEVDWEEVDLSRNFLLEFADPVASAEYKRFAHRDFVVLIVAAMWGFGCTVYPNTKMMNTNYFAWGCYACLMLLAIFLPIDVWAHIKQENTVSVATRRRYSQLFIAFGMPTACVTTAFYAYYVACPVNVYVFEEMGIKSPNLTPERIQWFCRDMMNPFAFIAMCCTVLFLFPPRIAGLNFLLAWTLEILVRWWAGDEYAEHPESTEQIAVKAVMIVGVSVMLYLLMVQRHISMTEQFKSTVALAVEMKRAKKREEDVDTLLCAMIPTSALLRLSLNEPVSDWTDEATVLFSDMISFTAWTSNRTPLEVTAMLNALCIDFDRLAVEQKVEKIKTIGDAYWAVCGLPDTIDDHAIRICDFGNAMLDKIDELNSRRPEYNNVAVRVGIHSGPLAGGILGTQQLSYEVYGDTSTFAEEVEVAGIPSRVTITKETLDFLQFPDGVVEHPVRELQTKFGAVVPLYVLPRMRIDEIKAHGTNRMLSQHHLKQHGAPGQHRSGTDSPGSSTCSASVRSSLFSRSTHSSNFLLSAESARKQRQLFLQRRAETGSPVSETLSLEEVEERYSKRKWNWIFFTFADDRVEQEYTEFVRKKQLPLRRVTRVFTLVLLGFVLFGIGLQGAHFSLAGSICFGLSALIGSTDAVLSFGLGNRVVSSIVHVVLHHFTAVSLLVGAGLTPDGASSATNDVTYLYEVVMMFLAIGNIGLVSTATLAGTNILVNILSAFLIWRVAMLFTSYIFFVQVLLILIFGLTIMEKHFRRQFLDDRVATFFRDQQHRRNTEQHALLKSVVPSHVVDELMVWLSLDLNLSKTIVKKFDCVSTAFIHLTPPAQYRGCWVGSGADGVNCTLRETFITHDPGSQEDRAPLLVGENTEAYAWLSPTHVQVDSLLEKYPAVDKIKTIGDVVMIAGSFHPEMYTCGEAAQQILEAVWEMRTISRDLQAGVHCGEIVGAVLGTNRLCFDIFGDSVNVASRAMTTGKGRASVFATDALYSLLQQEGVSVLIAKESSPEGSTERVSNTFAGNNGSDNENGNCSGPTTLSFGLVEEVPAKGKGIIQVRELIAVRDARRGGREEGSVPPPPVGVAPPRERPIAAKEKETTCTTCTDLPIDVADEESSSEDILTGQQQEHDHSPEDTRYHHQHQQKGSNPLRP